MQDYKRTIKPPPEELCPDGQCQMGNYNGAVANPDLLKTSAPLGFPLPPLSEQYETQGVAGIPAVKQGVVYLSWLFTTPNCWDSRYNGL